MKFTTEHLRAIADIADRMQTAARRDGRKVAYYSTEFHAPEGRARLEVAVDGDHATVRFLADDAPQATEPDSPAPDPIWGLVNTPTNWELGRLHVLPPDPREEIAKRLIQLNDTTREIAKELRDINRNTTRRARRGAK